MMSEEEKNMPTSPDTTAEMPNVEAAPADPTDDAPKGKWSAKKKGIAAGIAAVAVIACIGCGVAVASQQPSPADEGDGGSFVEQVAAKAEAAQSAVEFGIAAENWTDESSPMIVHVHGTDAAGNAVETYHAFTAGGDKTLSIAEGDYAYDWVSAINADGSIYKVPEAAELKVGSETAKAEGTFEQIPADQVTADDLNAVIDAATTAVERGDATLSGEAGKTAIDKVIANASANPNANKEQVEAKAEVANATATAKAEGKDASAAKQEAQQKAPASVTQNASQAVSGSSSSGTANSGSSSSGSSSAGGSSAPAHEHNWAAVTKTVHHDAVYETQTVTEYKTVHHDAVYEEVQVCSACGIDNPSIDHIKNHMKNHENGGTYSVYKCVKEAYDEKVPYQTEKNVLVKAAYDETVTTGYKCSTCGATK